MKYEFRSDRTGRILIDFYDDENNLVENNPLTGKRYMNKEAAERAVGRLFKVLRQMAKS